MKHRRIALLIVLAAAAALVMAESSCTVSKMADGSMVTTTDPIAMKIAQAELDSYLAHRYAAVGELPPAKVMQADVDRYLAEKYPTGGELPPAKVSPGSLK